VSRWRPFARMSAHCSADPRYQQSRSDLYLFDSYGTRVVPTEVSTGFDLWAAAMSGPFPIDYGRPRMTRDLDFVVASLDDRHTQLRCASGNQFAFVLAAIMS
jgi:hypothetical protein